MFFCRPSSYFCSPAAYQKKTAEGRPRKRYTLSSLFLFFFWVNHLLFSLSPVLLFRLSQFWSVFWILCLLMAGIMICIEYFSCLMGCQMGLNWLTMQKDRLSFSLPSVWFCRYGSILWFHTYLSYFMFHCRKYLAATNKEMELSVVVVRLR